MLLFKKKEKKEKSDSRRLAFLVSEPVFRGDRTQLPLRSTISNLIRSIRRFPYGCLVTTSPWSPEKPSRAKSPSSGLPDSPDVTGGEYKAQGRIHRDVADPRLLAIPTSRGRVAALDPN